MNLGLGGRDECRVVRFVLYRVLGRGKEELLFRNEETQKLTFSVREVLRMKCRRKEVRWRDRRFVGIRL